MPPDQPADAIGPDVAQLDDDDPGGQRRQSIAQAELDGATEHRADVNDGEHRRGDVRQHAARLPISPHLAQKDQQHGQGQQRRRRGAAGGNGDFLFSGHWPPRQTAPAQGASTNARLARYTIPDSGSVPHRRANASVSAVAATVKKTAAGSSQSPGIAERESSQHSPIRAAMIAAATINRQRSIEPLVLVAAWG